MTLALMVDFNGVKDGLVAGLLEEIKGSGKLEPGEPIALYDGEGNKAQGSIDRVDKERKLVFAKIDWPTWSEA